MRGRETDEKRPHKLVRVRGSHVPRHRVEIRTPRVRRVDARETSGKYIKKHFYCPTKKTVVFENVFHSNVLGTSLKMTSLIQPDVVVVTSTIIL